MKKYILTVPLLILVSGCVKENKETVRTDILKEFKAEIVRLETKSLVTPSGAKVVWEAGDEVLVDNGKATATFTYNSSRGVFATSADDFELADSYKAVYPASAYSSQDGTVFSDRQKIYPGYVRDLVMTASAGSDAMFRFTTVTAPVLVDFPQERLPDSNDRSVSRIVLQSQERTVTYESEGDVNVETPLFIAVPVGTYKGGISLDFTFADGSTFSLGTSEDVTVHANAITMTRLLTPWAAFSGGEGTVEKPYLLNSPGDFREFVNCCLSDPSYLSRHYTQTSDIDLSEVWEFTPLASSDHPFTGVYDGGGHSLRGAVASTYTGGEPTGLFRHTDGAVIRNLRLEGWKMTSKSQYLGGFAGYALRTAFENCVWAGDLHQSVREPMKDFESVTDNANIGITGGIAALAEDCSFKDCIFDGKVSATGKNAGGIVGYARNCSVTGCSSTAASEVYTSYHCAGTIAGALTQNSTIERKSVISECSAEGSVGAFDHCGAIVGYLQNGTVERCVVSSKATITGRQFNIGGIAGFVIPKSGETCVIDRCTVYADVKGQFCVGGIAGYIDCNDAAGKAVITNCSYIGGTLEATGTNENRYALVGGIAGWITKSHEVVVRNCSVSPKLIRTAVQNAPEASLKECAGGVAGLVGFCNNDNGSLDISNCWSGVSLSTFQHRYKVITAFPEFKIWGAVLGRCTKLSSLAQNYFCNDDELRGIADGQTGGEFLTGLTTAEIKEGLVERLNTGVLSLDGGTFSQWKAGQNGLPELECVIADPSPRSSEALRISIIGDSISSFAGYTPAGYNYHYPCADGSVTRVEQTYWHQLIYRKLKNARLDVNMSYSGSAVANSDEAANGSRKDHWCNNSYVQRYIRLGGIGDPDIVVIHGGTNDWAHGDFCPLFPGADDCSKAAPPTASDLEGVFSAADAAVGRSAIEALPHNDFCSAYAKLICLVKEQYPDAKIVCIIGDYLSEGIEKSILAIAGHYGAKCVNLLAVNGFNDQTYMPKHDYNGSTGCHPDSRAMTFIADKIYEEVGAWLEE